MNIMVLEDDANAMGVIDYLENQGHEVWHAQGLLDVAYFLEEDPGVDNFNKLLFDAAVQGVPSSLVINGKMKYGTKGRFSGLEFVINNYNVLKTKSIAIITAYSSDNYKKDFNDGKSNKIPENLVVIEKSSDNFMAQLLSFINDNEVDHV